MFDIDPTQLERDLAKAQTRGAAALSAWRESGGRKISDEQLSEARESEETRERQLVVLEGAPYDLRRCQQLLLRLQHAIARLLGQETLGWFPTALLLSAVLCAASMPFVLLLHLGLWLSLIVLAGILLTILLPVASVFQFAEQSAFGDNLVELDRWLERSESDRIRIEEELPRVRRSRAWLEYQRRLQTDYEAADAEVRRLERLREQLRTNLRYQLTHQDWRSLRGEAFEL